MYKWLTRVSLSNIPGPKPESFWLGSMGQLSRGLVGELDAAWTWIEQYGGVIRFKGPLSQDLLYVADARAMSFIFNNGYTLPQAHEVVAFQSLILDFGLVTTQDDVHKRQRKLMMPAFGAREAKALFPVFSRAAESISVKWRDELFESTDQSKVFTMSTWVSHAALDAISEAAFDHNFGAINNEGDEFSKSYQTLLIGAYASPADTKIILNSLIRFIPHNVLVFIFDRIPAFSFLHENRAIAHKFARQWLADKDTALAKLEGQDSRDVLSILMRANKSQDESTKMSEAELVAQMRTLLLAGHESAGTTLSCGLLELAKRPDIQAKLRKEIHDMEANAKDRGITAADVDNMPYIQACVKEILRLNPAAYHMERCAKEDVVIPVSLPIITKSGKEVQVVLVPKGTRIIILIQSPRDKNVWGEDALEFNPDRWQDEKRQQPVQVGTYANIATFSGGVRSCIGWRFAISEIQAFLIELIGNLEFTATEASKGIRGEPCLVMAPIIDGDTAKGAQVPLKVTLAQRET